MKAANQEGGIVSTERTQPPSIEHGRRVPAEEGRASVESRRRLLRGGMAVAPVLMTVASRPAMAGLCTNSSAMESLSGSSQTTMQSCDGGNVDYWVSKLSGTSASTSGYYMAKATSSSGDTTPLFGSVFGAGDYSDKTFLQVLQAGQASSADKAALAGHLVAAVLNARQGMTPKGVLDESLAREIWHSFSMRDYFEPTAGVQWSIGQTIDWLKTTMPLSG